jgi:hypothetical protein
VQDAISENAVGNMRVNGRETIVEKHDLSGRIIRRSGKGEALTLTA